MPSVTKIQVAGERSAAPALPKGKSPGRTSYSSNSIKIRRVRILNETRKMIGELGISALSMDEVARRAGVTKRTIYNIYQSKERLIAASIYQYFEDYSRKIIYTTEEKTLERIVEHILIVIRRNFKIRNYTRALMSLYYAQDTDPDIKMAIYQIAARAHDPWLEALHAQRLLQPWIKIDQLSNSLVTYRYGLVKAWAEGFMDNDAIAIQLVSGFLTFMAGATRGRARREIENTLKNLSNISSLEHEDIVRKLTDNNQGSARQNSASDL